jgi:PKD repeat protein
MVLASHDKLLTNDLRITGNVAAADTAQVVIHNPTSAAITVPAGTVRALVFPFIGTVTEEEAPPAGSIVASFTWQKAEEDDQVYFTDTSTSDSGIDTWSWDMDEGGPANTNQDPSNVFDDVDGGINGDVVHNYTVVLTITGPDGTDQATANLALSFNASASGSGS